MVTGCFPRAQQLLQLGHGQGRGDALRVFSVRRPGAAPGPGEPGHERHLVYKTKKKMTDFSHEIFKQ